MKKFEWLKGLWKIEKQDVFEKWVVVNDTALGAVSYHIDDDGEQIVDEMIQLVYRKGKYYYIPAISYPDKQRPTEFEVITVSTNKFTAENLQHDFPQRIVYELKDKNHLHAYIEGKETGKQKKIDLPHHANDNDNRNGNGGGENTLS